MNLSRISGMRELTGLIIQFTQVEWYQAYGDYFDSMNFS